MLEQEFCLCIEFKPDVEIHVFLISRSRNFEKCFDKSNNPFEGCYFYRCVKVLIHSVYPEEKRNMKYTKSFNCNIDVTLIATISPES